MADKTDAKKDAPKNDEPKLREPKGFVLLSSLKHNGKAFECFSEIPKAIAELLSPEVVVDCSDTAAVARRLLPELERAGKPLAYLPAK